MCPYNQNSFLCRGHIFYAADTFFYAACTFFYAADTFSMPRTPFSMPRNRNKRCPYNQNSSLFHRSNVSYSGAEKSQCRSCGKGMLWCYPPSSILLFFRRPPEHDLRGLPFSVAYCISRLIFASGLYGFIDNIGKHN